VLETLEIVIDRLPATATVLRFLKERLRAPGGVNWAPVGAGIALPHFTTRVALGHEAGTIAFLLLEGPMPDCEPPDGVPVRHLVFFIPPSPRVHLETLGRLSRALATGPLQELLRDGASDEALYGAIAAADAPGRAGAAP
jgi:PTS system nitrogen regulatory IIA component